VALSQCCGHQSRGFGMAGPAEHGLGQPFLNDRALVHDDNTVGLPPEKWSSLK